METDAAASSLPAPDDEITRRSEGGRNKQTRVVSARVTLRGRLREIWSSRELLVNLVSTEIKVKYKNSALGLVWSMVAPAISLLIFWFVFGVVLKNAYPNFVIYLFSGLLFWNYFQTGVSTATGVIVGRAGIVKKVAFPREILALSAIGTSGVFLFFQSLVMVLFMVVLQYAPDWKLLPLLLLALIATTLLGSALGIFLSATNVYLRDTEHLIEVVLTAWFWACPIVYSFWGQMQPKLAPHGLTWLYFLNPMTPVILTSQRVLYAHPLVHLTTPSHPLYQLLPPWGVGTYVTMDLGLIALGIVAFLAALAVFGRLEGNFAEEL